MFSSVFRTSYEFSPSVPFSKKREEENGPEDEKKIGVRVENELVILGES